MTRKYLCALGILVFIAAVEAQHRRRAPAERLPSTDGVRTDYPLPNPGSGPTTIALAFDGSLGSPRALGTASAG
jgi:hypothetical protein